VKARLEVERGERGGGGKRREGGRAEEWVRGVVRVRMGWMMRVRRRRNRMDVGLGNEIFSGVRMTFALIDREKI